MLVEQSLAPPLAPSADQPGGFAYRLVVALAPSGACSRRPPLSPQLPQGRRKGSTRCQLASAPRAPLRPRSRRRPRRGTQFPSRASSPARWRRPLTPEPQLATGGCGRVVDRLHAEGAPPARALALEACRPAANRALEGRLVRARHVAGLRRPARGSGASPAEARRPARASSDLAAPASQRRSAPRSKSRTSSGRAKRGGEGGWVPGAAAGAASVGRPSASHSGGRPPSSTNGHAVVAEHGPEHPPDPRGPDHAVGRRRPPRGRRRPRRARPPLPRKPPVSAACGAGGCRGRRWRRCRRTPRRGCGRAPGTPPCASRPWPGRNQVASTTFRAAANPGGRPAIRWRPGDRRAGSSGDPGAGRRQGRARAGTPD